MSSSAITRSPLHHRKVEVEGMKIHVVEGGNAESPAMLFLHGWPENWSVFEKLMVPLSYKSHVVAIDLPGIGASESPPPANDKRTLAKYVRDVIKGLGLRDVTLLGHDVGGMIVYAYLHAYPDELQRAVIMNVTVPGIDPWSEVKRNPHIWHFAFHAVPDLPEKLVAGQQNVYFAFFYDALSAKPDAIDEQARRTYVEAYSRPEALHTGFEWYRAFPQDEKDNLRIVEKFVRTPVLYLRGAQESGELEDYLRGLHEAGLRNAIGRLIQHGGHFAPAEQPEEVLKVLEQFMGMSV